MVTRDSHRSGRSTQRQSESLANCSVEFDLGCGGDHAEALFLREVAGRPFRHIGRKQVPIEAQSVEILAGFAQLIEASDCYAEGRKSLMLRNGGDQIMLIELFHGWAHVTAAGEDRAETQATCARVADTIRAPTPDDELVPITFWALDSNRGPRPMRRSLEATAWADIACNYTEEARRGMNTLLKLERPPADRMILWHGPPGTGKTHALRALARSWRGWCDVAFIVDPEEFFGSSPTYLLDVVNDQNGDDSERGGRRSQLVVLEDAGELMTVEARKETGQALSRLLNVTDGLLGQGFSVMVLITTNEPLAVLHPAVTRPGRCLAEIEFGPLSPDEGNAWLRLQGSEASVNESLTLADLYAILAGRPTARLQRRRPVGFTAALTAA